jgi:hypothetical protein
MAKRYSNGKARALHVKLHGFKYEKIQNGYRECLYCGDLQECFDHVPPVSLAYRCEGSFVLVPSCKNCNSYLSNFPSYKLSSRRKIILDRLLVRRKNILVTPDWDKDELGKMGKDMQKYIKKCIFKRNLIRNRIDHLEDHKDEEFCDVIKGFKDIEEII